MKDANLPTVVVFGVTGAQGGSVARYLLDERQWRVRGVSRTLDSAGAKRLAAMGVEMVAADLDAPETLGAAVAGADAAFVVTNYWEPQERNEVEQGRSVIDAALAEGVSNIVYSTLPDVKSLTEGRLEVPHYDGKATVAKHYQEMGAPVSYVQAGWYFQNLLSGDPATGISRSIDGALTLRNSLGPEGHVPGVDIDDLGTAVSAVLNAPEEFRGRVVPLCVEFLTFNEIAVKLSQVIGEHVEYRPVSLDEFAVDPASADLGDMFTFFVQYAEACWSGGDELIPGLSSKLTGFDSWGRRNTAALRAL